MLCIQIKDNTPKEYEHKSAVLRSKGEVPPLILLGEEVQQDAIGSMGGDASSFSFSLSFSLSSPLLSFTSNID